MGKPNGNKLGPRRTHTATRLSSLPPGPGPCPCIDDKCHDQGKMSGPAEDLEGSTGGTTDTRQHKLARTNAPPVWPGDNPGTILLSVNFRE